jgi:hypothetical protein
MKRPATLTITAVCVLVLILVSAVWPMVGGNRLLGIETFPQGMGAPEQGRFGGANASGTPSALATPEGTPSADQAQPGGQPQAPSDQQAPQGNPSDQNGQQGTPPNNGQAPQFDRQRQDDLARGGWSMFRFNGVLAYVLYALEIALGIAAIIGLWLSRRWGRILAIILAALVLIVTLPGLLQMTAVVLVVENVLKVLLSVGIMVLVLLPGSRLAAEPAK